LRHLFTLHDASRGRGGAGSIVGALEAQGLHPPEQINPCWLHRRRAERSAGHCDQVTAAHASRAGPGSSQRWRRFADRRRGKASLRRRADAAAKFFPVRGSRNLFLLSARGHEAIMTAREKAKETKRS